MKIARPAKGKPVTARPVTHADVPVSARPARAGGGTQLYVSPKPKF